MFDIAVIKNPFGDWNSQEGDHQTDLAIEFVEFEAIQNFLNISLPSVNGSEGEAWSDYHDRIKAAYINAASEKGYEMLGRFWYEYDDAFYLTSELNQLREECLKAKNGSQNPNLTSAADKILEACGEALKNNSGLFFGCD